MGACAYTLCGVHAYKYVHSFPIDSVGWVSRAVCVVCVCMRAQESVQTQIGRGVIV